MRLPLSITLLAVGIILLALGLHESQSISSDFSKFFTGNPTDRAVWMIVGGVAALIAGVATAFTPPSLFKR